MLWPIPTLEIILYYIIFCILLLCWKYFKHGVKGLSRFGNGECLATSLNQSTVNVVFVSGLRSSGLMPYAVRSLNDVS